MISQSAAILQLVVFGAKGGGGRGCFILCAGFFLWVLFIPSPHPLFFFSHPLLSSPFGFHFSSFFHPLFLIFPSFSPFFPPFSPSLPLFLPPSSFCFGFFVNKTNKQKPTPGAHRALWALATRASRGQSVSLSQTQEMILIFVISSPAS